MHNSQGLKLVEGGFNYSRRRSRVGELWQDEERKMHSLHYALNYRSGFKPEVSNYCITRFSSKGEIVFDPFCGYGTTALQANLLGRISWASDINPLAVMISRAKTQPVGLDEVLLKLTEVDFSRPVNMGEFGIRFSDFYHPETYRELVNLKSFIAKQSTRVSRFIQMLAMSRLHGHTSGYFSAYSFPQHAISPQRQRMLNAKRRQVPEYRSVAPRIIKKAAQVVRDGFSTDFIDCSKRNLIDVADARRCGSIPQDSVDLIVTSPPLSDWLQFGAQSWLESWFSDLREEQSADYIPSCVGGVSGWRSLINSSLKQFVRVLKPGRYAVLESGVLETELGLAAIDDVIIEEGETVTYRDKYLRVEEVLINQPDLSLISSSVRIENNSNNNNTTRLIVFRSHDRRRHTTFRSLKSKT